MKLSEKLSKIDDYFQVNIYDNGYMVEARGRDNEDEYVTAKIMVQSVDELVELVREAATMELDV